MGNEDDLAIALKGMGDALGQAQGFNRAHSYILLEVLCDLARRSPDPEKYLADMFERISARADQGDIGKEGHPATVEFRWSIENIFKHAGNAVRGQ